MQQNPCFKVFMDINHHKSIFRQSPPSFGFAKTTNNSYWLVPNKYPRPWGSTSFWGMTIPLLLFTPVNGGRTTPCGKYNLKRISVALRINLNEKSRSQASTHIQHQNRFHKGDFAGPTSLGGSNVQLHRPRHGHWWQRGPRCWVECRFYRKKQMVGP